MELDFKNITPLINSLPYSAYLKDINSNYLQCNHLFSEFVQLNRNDIIGKSDEDIFIPKLAFKNRLIDILIMELGELTQLEQELVIKNKNILIHSILSPVLDESNHVIGLIGYFYDITDYKKKQQRDQKISQLIRHDLKNPLSAIIGFTELLMMENLNNDTVEQLEYIYSSGKKMQSMIENLEKLVNISE